MRVAMGIVMAAMGALVAGVFVAVTGLAIVADLWQNGITKDEYLRRIAVESAACSSRRAKSVTIISLPRGVIGLHGNRVCPELAQRV